jgi:phosphatidylserine decarboxylase
VGTAAITVAAWFIGGLAAALLPFALFVWTLVVFHDPVQDLPAAPHDVLSPVDGKVEAVDVIDGGLPGGSAQRILIRANILGTYTARAPVEAKIMDLHGDHRRPFSATRGTGLWLRTDEGVDVVLQFSGYRFGLTPRSLVRYGERLGQGQPCAYLRLVRYAEVCLPMDSRILVTAGQRVAAGLDTLGKLASQLPEE